MARPNGLELALDDGFDPRIDPMVWVHPRQVSLLLKWGERHAAAIVRDESIPLRDRQFFFYRGLAMEAARLYQFALASPASTS